MEDEPEDAQRHETSAERYDRNFGEVLQELRVAQTGVQILFAFLLTTAFTGLLQRSDRFVHDLLAVTLVLAALATAVLIAPVALHRALFQQHLKEQVVLLSSALARVGLVLLMLAVSGTCLLALDAVLARPVALGLGAGVLAVFAVLWFVVPAVLARSRRR